MLDSGDGLSFKGWRDKLFFWIITAILGFAVIWAGWVTKSVNERVTFEEAQMLVRQEKALLDAEIAQLRVYSDRTTTVMDKTGTALNNLSVEVARLSERIDQLSTRN